MRHDFVRIVAMFVPCALVVTAPVQAQEADRVDELTRVFRTQHEVRGIVVATTTPQGDRVLSYGLTSDSTGDPIRADTRFELGSISKVFTGLLLAAMATDGDIGLDDPLVHHLPGDVRAPTHDGAEPTLGQLSSHTSGLPRLPSNLAPLDMSDPYAAYTEAALFSFLTDYELARAPGGQYEYSNLGVGLLGHLLARRHGESFAETLRARVLAPLGLADTYVPAADTADARMARGHVGATVVRYWRFGPLAGAGEVRSTAADMLRFLQLQLNPANAPLADAIRLSQERRARVTDSVAIALGWHISELAGGSSLYWHNGGTGGFRSFAGFVPGRDIGVVVLVNTAVPLQAVDRLGVQVIMSLLE